MRMHAEFAADLLCLAWAAALFRFWCISDRARWVGRQSATGEPAPLGKGHPPEQAARAPKLEQSGGLGD